MSALAVLYIAPDTIAPLHVVSVIVLRVCFQPLHPDMQFDSEMSFVEWEKVHGVGSSANRDGRRGAVQHCRVRTFNAVTSDTPCLVLECFSGDSQSCTNFECTVQLVIGLGSTHLPQRAERIWNDQQIVFSLAREVCCGHLGRFMLLWRLGGLKKFRSTVLHVICVGQQTLTSAACCFLPGGDV